MTLILSGNVTSATAAGYEVANSCMFNRTDSPKMSKTLGTPSDADKWTFSAWVKLTDFGTDRFILSLYTDDNNETAINFENGNSINFYNYISGSYAGRLVPNQKLRDPAAWYHLVAVFDSGNGTAGNRMRLYLNGSEITSFATDSNPNQDQDSKNASGVTCVVGRAGTDDYNFGGYMAEVCFCDGQAYAASDFGEFNEDSPRIWQPKDVSGLTFGNNGFYLDFEDSSNLGNDVNGGTDLSEANLAATDQMLDTPTNSFCTLNPLEAVTATTTYAQGNLAGTTSNAARATFAVNKGKWYWEHKFVNKEDMGGVMAYAKTDGSSWFAPNAYTVNALIQGSNPELTLNGTEQSSWSGDGTPDALVDNDILNVALDCDNNRIAFGVNGGWLNATDGSGEWSGTTLNYYSITTGYDYSPAFRTGSGTNRVSHMNFGSPFYSISSGNADANGYGNFEYAVPSGFFSLCSKNLAEYG